MEKKTENKASLIMNKTQIHGAIRKMAGQIVADFSPIDGVVMIGIRTRGADLTRRLVSEIEGISGFRMQIGFIDTTFYRDDVMASGPKPVMKKTEIPFKRIDYLSSTQMLANTTLNKLQSVAIVNHRLFIKFYK